METTEEKSHKLFRGPDGDILLQWGRRKRLRCVKVRESSAAAGDSRRRTTTRIRRRVVKVEKESSSPNRVPKELSKTSQPSSPDKEENRFYSTRGSSEHRNDTTMGNSAAIAVRDERETAVLPRFFVSLSSKEKEEDFMAMKGCKLPHRPKKRAKLLQRTILLVSPGAWLSDLCQERYEVREKKSSRKKKRGLKAMSMESDSE